MGGRIIEFTRDVKASIPVGILLFFGSGLFYAGVQFHSLQAMIREVWTYGMERETWLEVKAENPSFRIPDTEKIRKNHQANVFTDRTAVISQN